MSYEIVVLPEFARQVKRLAKRYRRIKDDLAGLLEILRENPRAGMELHHHCYKIRLANSSIPTGKSGGFRVIYYFVDEQENLYLLTIYSKTQRSTIDERELIAMLEANGLS